MLGGGKGVKPNTMLIEWAMATFGIIVPGVGTLHAPYSAWGAAATLQKIGAIPNVYCAGILLIATAVATQSKRQ